MLEVTLLSWSRRTELVETQSTEGPRAAPATSPTARNRRVYWIPQLLLRKVDFSYERFRHEFFHHLYLFSSSSTSCSPSMGSMMGLWWSRRLVQVCWSQCAGPSLKVPVCSCSPQPTLNLVHLWCFLW